MSRSLFVSGTFLVLVATSSASAQVDPPGVKRLNAVFDGDVRLAVGTKLELKQDFAGEAIVDVRGGSLVRGARDERPCVAVNLRQTVIDPQTRREKQVNRTLARGSELVITGISQFRTAFDSGSYVIAIDVTFPDKSTSSISLINAESARRFMTSDQFKTAIGDVIKVKQ